MNYFLPAMAEELMAAFVFLLKNLVFFREINGIHGNDSGHQKNGVLRSRKNKEIQTKSETSKPKQNPSKISVKDCGEDECHKAYSLLHYFTDAPTKPSDFINYSLKAKSKLKLAGIDMVILNVQRCIS